MSEVLVQKLTEVPTKVAKKTGINKDVTTEFSGETNKIIIPSFMSKKEAADDLMNQWNNEEQFQNFETVFEEWEWKDALRAAKITMEQTFGWVKGRETMFSSPTEISIVTNVKDGSKITEMAFAGPVSFPAWEGAKGEFGVEGSGRAYIALKAKKKFSILINRFFNDIRNFLHTQSIYRNKAVIVSSNSVPTKAGMVKVMALEITEIKPNVSIFLNEDQKTVIDNFIIDQLNDKGKRTFLFPGPYGNGKTETAINIGVEALKKGMSFFYVKEASQFTSVLTLAKNYEPCMIFLEDIDEIASGDGRNADINAILNTLDGVDTKGRDIITLFTTNHKDQINPALRRPGRIDLIVEFNNPDKQTVDRICKHYFERSNGSATLDYKTIVTKMPDASGAVVAEICKRAVKLAQRKGEITTEMVIAAMTSMKTQVDFMAEKVTNKDELKKAMHLLRDFNQGEADFQ